MRRRGYDRAEVDRLLDSLATRYEPIWRDWAELSAEVTRLEALLARRGDTMSTGRSVAARPPNAAEPPGLGKPSGAEEGALLEAELAELDRLERRLRSDLRVLAEAALEQVARAPEISTEPSEPGRLPPDVPAQLVSPESGEAAGSPPHTLPPAARPPALRRRRRKLLLGSLGIVAAVAAALVSVWQLTDRGTGADRIPLSSAGRTSPATTISGTLSAASPPGDVTAVTSGSQPTRVTGGDLPDGNPGANEAGPTTPPQVRLTLRAAGGDTWLLVRQSSEHGKLLFQGFLFKGESKRFSATRYWIRMGRPSTLEIHVDGKRVDGMPAGTANVVVTRSGLDVVSLG